MEIRLKWYTVFCTSLLGFAIALYFDVFKMIADNDITHISWVIVLLYLIFTTRIGYKLHFEHANHNHQIEWFTAETMLSLGMIGTVIGFIYMLSTIFLDINVAEASSLQSALGTMAAGMGTALWTTLVGLICSVSLKVQLIIIDKSNE